MKKQLNELAQKLIIKRKTENLSQSAFAKKYLISKRALQNYESGRCKIRPVIARGLGLID